MQIIPCNVFKHCGLKHHVENMVQKPMSHRVELRNSMWTWSS